MTGQSVRLAAMVDEHQSVGGGVQSADHAGRDDEPGDRRRFLVASRRRGIHEFLRPARRGVVAGDALVVSSSLARLVVKGPPGGLAVASWSLK